MLKAASRSASSAATWPPICFAGNPPLGERIKIEDQSFQVVGVLEKQGTMLGWSLDNRIIIPIREFLAVIWKRPAIDQIDVKAVGLAQLDEAREELRQTMRHIRHLAPGEPDDFSINQQDEFVKLFHQQTGTIAIIGLFVTSLSLFVGGIGIMNIMFVSVAERTREIGVRKAIGAKRRNILLQFLIEAACICLMGGLIGLGIAWLHHAGGFPLPVSGDPVRAHRRHRPARVVVNRGGFRFPAGLARGADGPGGRVEE